MAFRNPSHADQALDEIKAELISGREFRVAATEQFRNIGLSLDAIHRKFEQGDQRRESNPRFYMSLAAGLVVAMGSGFAWVINSEINTSIGPISSRLSSLESFQVTSNQRLDNVDQRSISSAEADQRSTADRSSLHAQVDKLQDYLYTKSDERTRQYQELNTRLVTLETQMKGIKP